MSSFAVIVGGIFAHIAAQTWREGATRLIATEIIYIKGRSALGADISLMTTKECKKMAKLEGNHWWYKGLRDLVINYCKGVLLDAGCGTGGLLERYENIKFGIDKSKYAIKECIEKGLFAFNVDINKLKRSIPFDTITGLDILYHKGVDKKKAVIGIFKSLKRGGRYILNEPAFSVLRRGHDKAVGGDKRFSLYELEALLTACGFTIEISTHRLPWLFIIILIRKLLGFSGSDLGKPILNSFFYSLVKIENWLIKRGIKIPFGSSIFIVAKK